jgi:hypothetical protein
MGVRVSRNATWPTTVSICRELGVSAALALVLVRCGAQPRQLIAVAAQPSNGDAIAPTGTLPFTAAGTFNEAPITQTNLTALWTSSNSSLATIDPNTGLATCVAAGGPVTITASGAGRGGTLHVLWDAKLFEFSPRHGEMSCGGRHAERHLYWYAKRGLSLSVRSQQLSRWSTSRRRGIRSVRRKWDLQGRCLQGVHSISSTAAFR